MSAYLDTRVSLFAGRLWPDAAFVALADATEAAVADTLGERGLPQLAARWTAQSDGQDTRSLEQRIIARLLDETRILIRPLAGDAHAFLSFWTARFEMSNVKTLLRSKMTGERPAAILARLMPMGGFGRLDPQALAHAEDTDELLRRLESGPYASIVHHARRAFEESRDPFSLDAALDRGYYEGLIHHAQPLETTQDGRFRALMANLVDRINLVWLLRYRFNYRLPPAQVYYLLIASRYSLDTAHLKSLVALDSTQAVLAALPQPWRTLLADAATIPDVFARMEAHAAAQARQVLRMRAPAIARAFAYLILRERDLRAVRAVLRGRRLGLGGSAIRQALQRSMPEAA